MCMIDNDWSWSRWLSFHAEICSINNGSWEEACDVASPSKYGGDAGDSNLWT